MTWVRWRGWEHLALVLIAIGGPLAQVFSSPIYSSGDEAAHVDYALQVWRGQLPIFENGLILGNEVGFLPSVQWTAQHPPLFYILLAPVVGPLADAGFVNAAGMAARIVVVALSVALIYAVRASARLLMPATPAVGTASSVIVGLSVWFTRLGGSVYNDILAATLVAVTLALLIAMLRGDRRWRTVIWFALASAACASTRLSIVPVAVLFAVTAGIGFWVVKGERRSRLLGAAALGPAAILVFSGWFYIRNVMLTGSISGGHPDWAVERTGRTFHTPWEVATDLDFWIRMMPQFSTQSTGWSTRTFLLTVAVLFILPAAAGVVMFIRRALAPHGPQRAVDLLVLAAIACAVGGIAAMQILHVAGAGSALPRYFFALVPLLAPFMALALLTPRSWPALLAVWSASRVAMGAAELDATLGRQFGSPQAEIQPVAAWIGFALSAAGAALLVTILAVRRRVGTTEVGSDESERSPR